MHFGDYFICPFGCYQAYYEKKGEIKQHLLGHTDEDLKKWGYARQNLKFEIEQKIDCIPMRTLPCQLPGY